MIYDPLIVDTFARVQSDIASASSNAGPPSGTLREIAGSIQTSTGFASGPRLDAIAASADEMLTMYELAGSLAGQTNVAETGRVVANHLRRLVPFTLCVFYLHDAAAGELEAVCSVGESASSVKELKIALGERLSG